MTTKISIKKRYVKERKRVRKDKSTSILVMSMKKDVKNLTKKKRSKTRLK